MERSRRSDSLTSRRAARGAAALDAEHDIAVVGEASDGGELDGLAATRELAPDPRLARLNVVMLTTSELDEYVFEALRSGASGFRWSHGPRGGGALQR